MIKDTLVIKLGGALIENDASLNALFDGLSLYLKDNRRSLVLVHGGGCLVDDLLKGLGLKSEKKKGLRVTPPEHMPYIAGALAGTANKLMMAKAVQYKMPAVGLSLADDGMCVVEQMDPELGSVGAAHPGSARLLQLLLDNGYMPVVSSIGIAADGRLMNVNADQAATSIAMSLGADLALLSDVDGILDSRKELITEIDSARAAELVAEGVITGGMEVKVKAALEAAATLGKPVSVAGWKHPEKLSRLLAGEAIGTRVLAK
ncbi:MAG: acetylglutamate kinase [Succinivibrionaceae bacterium]|nr:acetylglutamate kinase [Succinivibrionaceae bacterium]